MLGIIDEFKFEINPTQLDSISHEISWNWTESQRIGNHVKLQATGKSQESFTFSGTLILKSINSFDELIKMANVQKPISLSFLDNASILVVIESIKKDMSLFLNTGESVKQGFTISLKRWYK